MIGHPSFIVDAIEQLFIRPSAGRAARGSQGAIDGLDRGTPPGAGRKVAGAQALRALRARMPASPMRPQGGVGRERWGRGRAGRSTGAGRDLSDNATDRPLLPSRGSSPIPTRGRGCQPRWERGQRIGGASGPWGSGSAGAVETVTTGWLGFSGLRAEARGRREIWATHGPRIPPPPIIEQNWYGILYQFRRCDTTRR